MQTFSTLCVALLVFSVVRGGVDPGLPDPKPTTPGWYYDYTDTNNAQFQYYRSSAALPTAVQDYAVIGGGWSGVSTAYHLASLQTGSTRKTITLLEARGISDGASGRNLGWMAPKTFVNFNASVQTYGLAQTLEQIEFERYNAQAVLDLADNTSLPDSQSEIGQTGRFLVYTKVVQSEFNQALTDYFYYNTQTTYYDTLYIPALVCNFLFRVNNTAGCFYITSHYRLRTPTLVWALFNKMMTTYQTHGVTAWTRSPVTNITSTGTAGSKIYSIYVNGTLAIKAKNVVFAANAWTSHLIPSLRYGSGSNYFIFSAQQQVLQTKPVPVAPIVAGASVEYANDVYGLWQRPSNQRGLGGYICAQGFGFLNSSDSQIDPGFQVTGPVDYTGNVGGGALTFVRTVFPATNHTVDADHIWTGVQGFTSDSEPFVGQLQATNPQLFISAGFNGHGNPRCFGSGQALAQQILGLTVSPAFPLAYQTTSRAGFIAGALVGTTF